jgi:hypothetical protein
VAGNIVAPHGTVAVQFVNEIVGLQAVKRLEGGLVRGQVVAGVCTHLVGIGVQTIAQSRGIQRNGRFDGDQIVKWKAVVLNEDLRVSIDAG